MINKILEFITLYYDCMCLNLLIVLHMIILLKIFYQIYLSTRGTYGRNGKFYKEREVSIYYAVLRYGDEKL